MHRQVSHDAAEGEGVGPWARRHSPYACILVCLQQPFWGVRISNGRIRRAEHPRGATQRLKSNFQGFAAVRWLAMHACICARVHAPAQRVHATRQQRLHVCYMRRPVPQQGGATTAA